MMKAFKMLKKSSNRILDYFVYYVASSLGINRPGQVLNL